MKLEFTPFEERLDKIATNTKKYVKFQTAAQKILDAVRFTSWDNDKIKSTCHIATDWISLSFSFENTPVDEFIEKILGKLHRMFGFFWTLNIGGSVEDPVFEFKPKNYIKDLNLGPYSFHFRVKEGEFSSCRVEEVIEEAEKVEWQEVKSSAKTHLKLICE